MTKSTKISGACVLALCGLSAVLTAGCDKLFMQKPLCSALGDCGGDPSGSWALAPGHPSCVEDPYTPPPDPRLVGADLPPARMPPPDPATYDWCDLLIVTGGDQSLQHAPKFFTGTPPVGAAWVRYQNGVYTLSVTQTGTFDLNFSPTCVRAFGAKDGRAADINPPALPDGGPAPLGPSLSICKQIEVQVPLKLDSANKLAIQHVTCDPTADGGCGCTFDLFSTVESTGPYSLQPGNILLQLSATAFPQRSTFCNRGDHLELTGADGAYLFSTPGLRTLDLQKVDCADGKMGPGEKGIDCGFACPTACP
jgi:hypothetical protein